MICIKLNKLALSLRIGTLAHELAAPQPYFLSFKIYLPDDYDPNDNILSAVDYYVIREGALALAGNGHIHLHETFLEEILAMCFAHDPRVLRVHLEGCKANDFTDMESVALVYDRTKAEQDLIIASRDAKA